MGDVEGILKRMKKIAGRMRMKGSRLLRTKPITSVDMARAEIWEYAAIFLEEEIDAFEEEK